MNLSPTPFKTSWRRPDDIEPDLRSSATNKSTSKVDIADRLFRLFLAHQYRVSRDSSFTSGRVVEGLLLTSAIVTIKDQ